MTQKPSGGSTSSRCLDSLPQSHPCYGCGNAGQRCFEVYNPKFAKWNYNDLSILPENWQFVVGQDKQEQYQVLYNLMHSNTVNTVVNACDAGREGEAIFRTVYNLAKCKKSMQRLWISSMEDSAIRQGIDELKSGITYE